MEMAWFSSVIEQGKEEPPDLAFTALRHAQGKRLGLAAFFEFVSELWRFPVSEPVSPQPPVTRAVGRLPQDHKHLICYG